MEKTSTIALFIDAENEPNHIEDLLKNLQKRGVVFCRRIYGKTTITKAKWQGYESLGLKIVAHSSDKQNATDIYLSIDAIDILHQKKPDIICIAAGDKDYIPLINAIRENGVYCIIAARSGSMYGKLSNICDEVITIDHKEQKATVVSTQKSEQAGTIAEKCNDPKNIESDLLQAAKKILKETKKALNLGTLCSKLYADKTLKEKYGVQGLQEKLKGKAGDFFREKGKTVFSITGKGAKTELLLKE